MKENYYDELFQQFGNVYNIDWLLLKAQIKQESNFNPKAENTYSHAKGLAQFMEATWLEWGKGDIFIPENNLLAQAKYMRWLLDRFKNKEYQNELALASYNWGIGNIQNLISQAITYDFELLKEFLGTKKKKLFKMPDETKKYVSRILSFYKNYKLV